MSLPYELRIGLRYTRAGRRARRRNGFISFISGISMIGIALGVMALIVVLSVMNGFVSQVRDRMLSVVSHVEVFANNGALSDWRAVEQTVRRNPAVIGAAPYINAQGLLTRGDSVRGVLVRGIEPAAEPAISEITAQLRGAPLSALVDGEFGIVLGGELARTLGVLLGEKVTLIAPQGQVTPAGVVPRL
ncbi:MAG TPA: ABC transporter permease, partial [Burkholderiaceae bacterium]|nr:ABC transporter permease [Burkholderiaceae bacterium]